MPRVARPHPLYAVALCELAEDGVYPVVKPTEEGARFGIRVSLLGGVWSEQLDPHARQLLPGLGRVVVAIPDNQPRGKLGEFGEHGKLFFNDTAATEKRVITPGQQTLTTCTLKP